ncbi:hypothetical protein F1737_03995 [Methanoplanus sp. FWC-SCC4]|uniref:2'-5' RNA ligase n=1 Tax=Methanochimaera problematica TaxID=2609417 RepID=A0AA97I438_9EURY|nr:hypothetical protein [Methanoplanus sp. FWC-SCC4]WOF15916.1 hypothetical protein F1737_03995 [Methanoplanus sp. FWC-SCC4]
MSEKIYAIDIVFLPPENIMDLSISINKTLNSLTKESELILDKKGCLPHISVAMGSIKESDLVSLKDDLKKISDRYLPYFASIEKFAVVMTSANEKVSGIDLNKDNRIIEIQNDIASALLKYHTGNITEEMVYNNNNPVSQFTLEYSSDYLQKSTGENYSPHITLGNGDVSKLNPCPGLPFRFTCNKIAVCHLGNNCTCPKILFEISSGI